MYLSVVATGEAVEPDAVMNGLHILKGTSQMRQCYAFPVEGLTK